MKRQGILGNTMIAIDADNGTPLPRSKTRLYDSGIKTPWIVHYPDRVKGGSVSKSLVSVIDLSATFLELADVEKPASIQGQGFVPILEDPQSIVPELVFFEHNWHVFKSHERMVRFGDYVYIKNNYPNQMNLSVESSYTSQTGDTIPETSTFERFRPPYIENGKIVPRVSFTDNMPHAEMAGAAKGAMTINHAGPIRL